MPLFEVRVFSFSPPDLVLVRMSIRSLAAKLCKSESVIYLVCLLSRSQLGAGTELRLQGELQGLSVASERAVGW